MLRYTPCDHPGDAVNGRKTVYQITLSVIR